MLILAAGGRLEYLTKVLATGAITGPELHKRIELWNALILKLQECIADETPGDS